MARKEGSGMDNRRHRNRITAEIPVWCLYVCPECGKELFPELPDDAEEEPDNEGED